MDNLMNPTPTQMPVMDGPLRVCYCVDWKTNKGTREYRFHCWGNVATVKHIDGVTAIVPETFAIIECYETGKVFTVVPESVTFKRTKIRKTQL
jgi:hypothetical protein